MELSAKNIIEKYGSTVLVSDGEKTFNSKGIIRPLYYKDKSRAIFSRFPTGVFDNRHYFVMLSPDVKLRKTGGETLECGGEKYRVNSNGVYFLGNRMLYVWAVLTACTDHLEDDYD